MSAPDPPTDIVCVPGNLSLIFSWTAPVSSGDAPITQYTITLNPGNITQAVISDGTNPPETTGTVNNLKGGVAYIFTVSASNIYGSSIPSGSVIPATVPSPVTAVKAIYTTASNTITVTWVAPKVNGGAPITSYTVSALDDTMSETTDGPVLTYSYTTGFITEGTYTFKVVATNSAGSSTSTNSNPVVFLDPPTNGTKNVIASGINLSWTPPDQEIGKYTIFRYIPPNSTLLISTSILGSLSTFTLAAVSGGKTLLQNGITYITGLRAENNTIFSPIAWIPSTLFYGAPVRPISVIASTIGQTTTATLTWEDATTNREITAYNITSDPAIPGIPYSTTESTITISSLIYGTPYNFAVSATNSVGTSPVLRTATEIIPQAVPDPPSTLSIRITASTATLSWTTPTSTGGSPITGYIVSSTPPGFTFSTLSNISSFTIDNITDRAPYTFDVVATNAVGNSAALTTSSVIMNDTPEAPSSITAVQRNLGITLFWDTPASSSPIIGYRFSTINSEIQNLAPTIYYDIALSTATIGPLEPTDFVSIQAINSLGAGLAASYGPITTEPHTSTLTNGLIPGYISTPTTRHGIFAKLGQFVTFMEQEFINYKFFLPIGEWKNNTELGAYIASIPGVASARTITSEMSLVLPEVDDDISVILYENENFSGNSLTYTETTPYDFNRFAGDHTSLNPFASWGGIPRSVVVRQNAFMGMDLSKVIPGNDIITLPITITEASTITVKWGDGSTDTYEPGDTVTHTYTTYGDFSIQISGSATSYGVGNGSPLAGASLITKLTSWGPLGITSYSGAFSGCSALISVPAQLPSTVTNTSYMFKGAYKFNKSLTTWIMTNVTDVTQMFHNSVIIETPAKLPTIDPEVTGFSNLGVYTLMYITARVTSFTDTLLTLPFTISTSQNLIVDWGDSAFDTWTSTDTKPTHNYTSLGNFTIGVLGNAISYGVGTESEAASGNTLITGVTDWGDLGLSSLSGAFFSNNNLTTVPPYFPSTVTDLSATFYGATSFNSSNVITWDMSGVTTTSQMFHFANRFNQNISGWNTKSVISMDYMFSDAYSFLQDLTSWNVSTVTLATNMFNDNRIVNKPAFIDISDEGSASLAFISTYTGVTAGTTITLPFTIAETDPPNFVTIAWGDAVYTSLKPEAFSSGTPSYTYPVAGTYTVAVNGVIE